MSMTFKGDVRSSIVERRWKARKIWQGISMPDHLLVRNNPDGTPRDEPVEVCLDATRDLLERIGNSIFVRNFRKHYVAVSADDPHRISYAGGIAHKFDNNRRMKTTLQRYVARNFPDEREVMFERGLEMFIEKFKAESLAEFDNLDNCFTIVKGQRLKDMFRQSYGETSCMTGSGAEYVAMYRDNPDVCQLLMFDDGEYKARAMLFTTNEGKIVCDRVYPNGGPHIEKFKMYCDDKGYSLRDFMGYPSSDYDGCMPSVDFTSGDTYSITVKVPRCGDSSSSRMMPYMDSFHWGNWIMEDQGLMMCYNHPIEYPSVTFKFDSTSGRINTFVIKECYCCNERIGDEDSRRHGGETYCGNCFDEEFTYCERCDCYERREEFTEINRTGRSSTEWCENCTSNYALTCDECDEYYRNQDITEYTDASDGSIHDCCEDCGDELTERKDS